MPVGVTHSNIRRIAHKELKSYFSWLIAYRHRQLLRYFFVAILSFFVRQSMQIARWARAAMVTSTSRWSAAPAERRSSSVPHADDHDAYLLKKAVRHGQLLLTSPLTDLQIVLGKFFGAMGLYAVMLAVSLIHVGLLFSWSA
jgi:hypothetical protein